ncbi:MULTISPECIES: cysteine desulfurase family protein [Citromicrobium]|uniref:cysteine desulfurase family protein n=1 Tax=Citromicrobium TaxID=72173 RepID=UPI0001DD0656|nr:MULTISPECIES: aminotransferase class V-fold PLP-dependent enzyme [Citromicrobium]ALG60779.1 aminotransferase [Citromicrobium sp. JL477]KPM13309.1 aminotransferase [Citromicrobium sp. JL1351]KPM14877.1 aminotransferase [Citromicrobium sp. JL31]KPM22373.1 aminotransferase [Citromicrobium sp. JL2201]
MSKPRVYLDHAATSPLRPEAKAAMEEGFAIWANPSSPHAEGRKAKQALEDARARVKAALEWDGEVIFTSGASESALLAFDHAAVINEAVSVVEHDALHCFVESRDVASIPVGEAGAIDLEALAKLIEPSPIVEGKENRSLVAVQHVNSETGTIQNIEAIAEVVRDHGGLLLVDCAQSAGKMPLPDCDMAIVSAHKFGGPIGVGALLVRDFAMLKPSGGHERGYRRGTENLPDILGMAAALEAGDIENWATTVEQQFDFKNELFRQGEVLRMGMHCSHIIAVAHPTMSAQAQLIRLDAKGFAVSAGSACSSGTLKKSRVLDAFGVSDDVAARTIRVSMGWSTTPEELEAFAQAWGSLT